MTRPTAMPVRDVPPWAILGGWVLLLAIYLIGAEEGATSVYVHEFVHDGRHPLGFPCH